MKKLCKFGMYVTMVIFLPMIGHAQDTALSTGIGGLQAVLDQLYQTMLPLCSQLIGVAQGIAGFAALAYIGIRVGRHLANAEPVDVVPLLRPFGIGLAITQAFVRSEECQNFRQYRVRGEDRCIRNLILTGHDIGIVRICGIG